MSRCHVCGADLSTVIDFGPMPISNRFLTDHTAKEYKFNLRVGYCPECHMVQLEECVPPEEMFNSDYAFFSSTSDAMATHFQNVAEEIVGRVSECEKPFVVELGCNDGIMLRHLADKSIPHLGIEPSSNVAASARMKGVNVITEFFNVELAHKISNEHGHASVICGSNVICHIEDINSVFAGVSELLDKDGVFFFEDPYIYDIVRKTSFDQIYDEHVFYFSVLSVTNLARRHGLELVDVRLQDVHGGEARYYLMHQGVGRRTDRVEKRMVAERELGLDRMDGYSNFRKHVNRISTELKALLERLKSEGHCVAAYGATSKSTTLLNYAGIGQDLIEYISDTTPTKIGKFCPGTHIPVRAHTEFQKNPPPYAVLLAWNHKKEIFAKEQAYRDQGGHFITFFPEVTVE